MVRIINTLNDRKIFIGLTVGTILISTIGIFFSVQKLFLRNDKKAQEDRVWQSAERVIDRDWVRSLAEQYVRFDDILTEERSIASMKSFSVAQGLYLIRFERGEMCGIRGCLYLLLDANTKGVTPLQIESDQDLPIEIDQDDNCLQVTETTKTTNFCSYYEGNKLVYKPK